MAGEAKLHIWDAYWDLRVDECPCDVQFCDWLEKEKITNAAIFHFGTGGHHIVGIRTAENGSNNAVMGITASPQEYETFVQLAIERDDHDQDGDQDGDEDGGGGGGGGEGDEV